MMKYKILLNDSEEGYSVSVPGLPGCWSQGETEEAAFPASRFTVRSLNFLAMRFSYWLKMFPRSRQCLNHFCIAPVRAVYTYARSAAK